MKDINALYIVTKYIHLSKNYKLYEKIDIKTISQSDLFNIIKY